MVLIFWLSMWWLVRGDRPQEASFEAHGDLAGLMQLRPRDESESNLAERNAAFDALWRRYFSHYRNITGRSIPGLKHWEIPVQYEFEIYNNMYHMNMTPEMLLVRGRIESPSLVADFGEAFESTPLWDIGIDGYGSSHSQSVLGCPEAASAFVRPETVLNGTLANELVQHMRNKMHVPESQSKDKFQFTFGIQLERISDLMKRTRSLQKRVKDTRTFCESRQPKPCSRRYEGLMLLCQMVLDHAAKAKSCGFPKRFQTPWLLRTHVGDLAMTLDKDERSHLAHDVLKLLGGDHELYPKGIMDYLLFPEMAEVGGVVKKRLGESDANAVEMPTDLEGLKKVAAMMLQNRGQVDHHLSERTCTLNAPGNKTWSAPTAREWLEGAQQGLDLMSDHDSPAAQVSLSKNLWKSMGSWRLSKEEPRIFLECRMVNYCLDFNEKRWSRMSYDERFQAAARFAHELEQLPL